MRAIRAATLGAAATASWAGIDLVIAGVGAVPLFRPPNRISPALRASPLPVFAPPLMERPFPSLCLDGEARFSRGFRRQGGRGAFGAKNLARQAKGAYLCIGLRQESLPGTLRRATRLTGRTTAAWSSRENWLPAPGLTWGEKSNPILLTS